VQRDRLHRQRWWAPLVWVALLAVGAWLAVTSSPWWWVGEAIFAALLVHQLWLLEHLQRRIELLQGDDADGSPAGAARGGSASDGARPNRSPRNGPARHRRPPGTARPTARRGTSDHSARHR
jgi:hypothetical protein